VVGVYALLFAVFAEGAHRFGDNLTLWGILFSAIVGALIAIWIVHSFSWLDGSWAFLMLTMLLGGAVDVAGNLLWQAFAAWHYLARSAWIGLANLGMLAAALAAGIMVSKGLRRVSYLVLGAVTGAVADAFSVFAGPTKHLIQTDAVFFLSFQWGSIGQGGIKPIVGVGDFIFLALFFAGSQKFGWNTFRTLKSMMIAVVVGFTFALVMGVGLPALPFFALALLIAHFRELQLTRPEWVQVVRLTLVLAVVMAVVVMVRNLG